MERLDLTEELRMDILFGEPALYPRQKEVYDAAFRGERNGYDLVRWGKTMNVASLRQRLYYHGREIVLGGDAYAHMWETETATPATFSKFPTMPPCPPPPGSCSICFSPNRSSMRGRGPPG